MELNKKELIEKLEVVSGLWSEAESIRQKMKDFVPDDSYERSVIVPAFPDKHEGERDALLEKCDHSAENAVEKMGDLYDIAYAPKKPGEPKINDFKAPSKTDKESSKTNKYGCLSVVGAIMAIFFALGFLFALADKDNVLTFPIIIGLSLIGLILFVVSKIKVKMVEATYKKRKDEALAEYNKEKDAIMADYDAKMREYSEATESHKLKKIAFLEEYTAWREIYLESIAEERAIAEKLERDRVDGVEKINNEELFPVLAKLGEVNDLVSDKYLPVVDTILDLIKSGRADGFKEALNLYEEIDYRERQLQLQREQEEQRRLEERLRRQDAERRHREQMELLEEQEYQRREEEAQRERAAERRHREELAQRAEQERNRQYEAQRQRDAERRSAERAEAERKRQESDAMRRQCNTCAMAGKCSMAFRRPNCASYRPR